MKRTSCRSLGTLDPDRALHASPVRQSEKSCLRDRGSGGPPQHLAQPFATRLAIATIVRIGGLPSAHGSSA